MIFLYESRVVSFVYIREGKGSFDDCVSIG